MLATKGIDIAGKRIAISGFGNVAWGAASKATQLGAKVVTIRDLTVMYMIQTVFQAKDRLYARTTRIGRRYSRTLCRKYGVQFFPGKRPWEQKVDIALPCATQNELDEEDAKRLIENGVICVGEISNMGCRPEAIDLFIKHRIMYGPGKAVNAGGVATSGLEMTQNAMHISWSAEEVDQRLHQIMSDIHTQCVKYGTETDGYINYMKGANIAGFMKVAKAMMAQGVI